jgi:hypothetical protein
MGPVGSAASHIHRGVITFERIDKAVEEILSRGSPPSSFIDWVGDVVATIVVKAPEWKDMSNIQRTEVIASLFAKLSFSKAKAVLPVTDERILERSFSRQRLASQVTVASGDSIKSVLHGGT